MGTSELVPKWLVESIMLLVFLLLLLTLVSIMSLLSILYLLLTVLTVSPEFQKIQTCRRMSTQNFSESAQLCFDFWMQNRKNWHYFDVFCRNLIIYKTKFYLYLWHFLRMSLLKMLNQKILAVQNNSLLESLCHSDHYLYYFQCPCCKFSSWCQYCQKFHYCHYWHCCH